MSQKISPQPTAHSPQSPGELAFEYFVAVRESLGHVTSSPKWTELAAGEREAWEKMHRDMSLAAREPLMAIIGKEEEKQNHHFCGTSEERLKAVLAQYRNRTSEVISGAKHFRDDLLVWFRAFSIVASMAGNATTHKEKDARIRGLIEIIEQTSNKLREQNFDFHFREFAWHSAFESDFPTREFLGAIHEKDNAMAAARKKLQEALKAESGTDVSGLITDAIGFLPEPKGKHNGEDVF